MKTKQKVKIKFTESSELVAKMFEDKYIKILGISNFGLGGYTIWYIDNRK